MSMLVLPSGVHAFKTKASSALLIDYDSGAEIVGKNADTLMPPSSMIKLMTLGVLFKEIKAGNITLDDRMLVSENADYNNPTWYPASKICLSTGQTLTVRDAIYGIIVQSGGDASVVVAESLAGSEEDFTEKMYELANDIGMEKSTFGNATGLPDPENLMTSRELALLGEHLISAHPDLYPMFATKRFEFDEYQDKWCKEWGLTHTANYNKLLFIMNSADGMKTGHTAEGGYGMVASAKQRGRRLIAVVNGMKAKNHNELAEEVKRLMTYGFTKTKNKTYFEANEEIVKIPVWYGSRSGVVGTVEKPFVITFEMDDNVKDVRILARYNEPLSAPIKAGDKVGEIIAELNGEVIARKPLIAADSVGKINIIAKVFKNISIILGKIFVGI